MSGHLCLKWNNHSTAFLSSISNIQTKEKYCDATIACQGKYFPVHRVILSTCSEYFEEMFERIVCPHPYIVFKDIEPVEMELLLNYMYQGEVNVVQEKLPTLIKAAEALKIKGLAVPDDLPSNKESSGRKRSHQSDETSYSKRRGDEKRKRSSSDLSLQSDSCRDSTSSNLVSRVRSEVEEEPKLIKEEPVDNNEYVEASLLSNEFSGTEPTATDNVLPSASSESECLNKTENEYSKYDPLTGENSFTKCEDNLASEETFDNQSTSWADFGDSDLQNLNMPQTSQQDDVIERTEGDVPAGRSHNTISTEGKGHHLPDFEIPMERGHQGQGHKCPYCNYGSYYSTTVRRHIQARHTGERPFQCQVCLKRFIVRGTLVKHYLKHHPDVVPPAE